MYNKQWKAEQIDLFANAAVSILSALPSSFSPLTDKDGNKIPVEGRKDTPQRFTKMLMEMLEGELYTNDEIVDMFKEKVFTQKAEHVINCDFHNIKCFSFCEHHLALMYDISIDVKIDYQPNEDGNVKVVGLSKIPRICDLVCKRLQLQERITTDIHYIISKLLGLPTIVTVKGKHSCVSARGIKRDITFVSQMNSDNELVCTSEE